MEVLETYVDTNNIAELEKLPKEFYDFKTKNNNILIYACLNNIENPKIFDVLLEKLPFKYIHHPIEVPILINMSTESVDIALKILKKYTNDEDLKVFVNGNIPMYFYFATSSCVFFKSLLSKLSRKTLCQQYTNGLNLLLYMCLTPNVNPKLLKNIKLLLDKMEYSDLFIKNDIEDTAFMSILRNSDQAFKVFLPKLKYKDLDNHKVMEAAINNSNRKVYVLLMMIVVKTKFLPDAERNMFCDMEFVNKVEIEMEMKYFSNASNFKNK